MNPALRSIAPADRKRLLAAEARWRKSGDWGPWETIVFSLKDFGPIGIFGRAHTNRAFSVLDRFDYSGTRHFAIASLSGIRPTWPEMQRIKNELAGADATAIEVYPPQAEVVDGAPMYHLWVLAGPPPFGLHRRQ